MIHLDYRDCRPIYAQIVDNYRILIQKGILQEGDKLPSVRELAGELSINPNTIQRAYREMEAAGLIASVTGKGSFVCANTSQIKESQPLWEQLDSVTAQLRSLGISQYEIIQHLKQGGDIDA